MSKRTGAQMCMHVSRSSRISSMSELEGSAGESGDR